MKKILLIVFLLSTVGCMTSVEYAGAKYSRPSTPFTNKAIGDLEITVTDPKTGIITHLKLTDYNSNDVTGQVVRSAVEAAIKASK